MMDFHDSNSKPQDGAWVPEAVNGAPSNTESLAPLPLDRGVMIGMTETGDVDAAVASGREYVDAVFTTTYGAQVAEFENEAAFLRSRCEVENKALERDDNALASEPAQIPAPMENGGVEGPGDVWAEVPLRDWQLRDQLTAALTVVGVIGLSIASFAGIQATFDDAKLPIFESHSYLSYMLAILAPTAGLAVKFIGNVFTDPANRDRYRKLVSFTGGISFFVWVVMFASLFEGLSGNFDPFAEPKRLLGWSFNLTHIIAEVLIAAGLFAQLEAVMLKYAPSVTIDNPVRPALERARKPHLNTVAALTARLGRIEGELSQLQGLKASTHVLAETAIRQRMTQTPRDTLL